jgi:hypothetical protein
MCKWYDRAGWLSVAQGATGSPLRAPRLGVQADPSSSERGARRHGIGWAYAGSPWKRPCVLPILSANSPFVAYRLLQCQPSNGANVHELI